MYASFKFYTHFLIIFINGYISNSTPQFYDLYGKIRRPSECVLTPKTCPNENITFYLYTTTEPDKPMKLSVDDPESIRNAKFIQGPIKLTIHGYTGHKDGSPNKEIRPEYLKRCENINVICVDYGPLAKKGCYPEAVKNSRVVSNCTAQFLTHLLEIRREIQLSQIHIVAFSLGAHVAGQIKEYFSGGQIERITALDAALPLFMFRSNSKEINRGDAKFIDALHTNGGMSGKFTPFADVDFYANNGCIQPHCDIKDTRCHHCFAPILFAESINTSPRAFRARKFSFPHFDKDDDQWEIFGEYVNLQARGTYFFKTKKTPPYALPPEDNQ